MTGILASWRGSSSSSCSSSAAARRRPGSGGGGSPPNTTKKALGNESFLEPPFWGSLRISKARCRLYIPQTFLLTQRKNVSAKRIRPCGGRGWAPAAPKVDPGMELNAYQPNAFLDIVLILGPRRRRAGSARTVADLVLVPGSHARAAADLVFVPASNDTLKWSPILITYCLPSYFANFWVPARPWMPPPPSISDQQFRQWSRPRTGLCSGVRPNSPIATTTVES